MPDKTGAHAENPGLEDRLRHANDAALGLKVFWIQSGCVHLGLDGKLSGVREQISTGRRSFQRCGVGRFPTICL